jgi:DNA-binding protein HU-beta
MAKKTTTATTVTLKHLAAAIAEEQELSKKKAEEILNDLVGRITKHLKKGERIRIVGLGILQVRKRAARMGRNPATGEAIHIKASKKVAFRAAKELKEAVPTLTLRHSGAACAAARNGAPLAPELPAFTPRFDCEFTSEVHAHRDRALSALRRHRHPV